jgi:hypothetical protein
MGFGGINMVDGLYNGSYSNVKVTDNRITGELLFAVGIAMGACTWAGGCGPYFLSGPATVSNNTFSGNISFPMAINGWKDGLNVMSLRSPQGDLY